ncbi:MAG: polyprenyl synthetase family protein [Desulfobacterota bacterium]|nr:polyprenyl synthetase family protein [Thermodesulfobacteriota bacterium]
MDGARYLNDRKQMVDAELDRLLGHCATTPPELHEALRYCVFAGGKRIRPILALAAAEALGGRPDDVVREACALELIHTYTLVHDDLPSMDDDDFRRGRPTMHTVYGEAIAILAGDALQAEAFAVLAGSTRHRPEKLLQVIHMLAEACGPRGIVGGQVVDILSEGKTVSRETLEYIHHHKTGCLITASVMLGALLASTATTPARYLDALKTYGDAIGLAFQITDDILDVTGTSETMGKTAGVDQKRGKATYPSIIGLEEARIAQKRLYHKALTALDVFQEEADPLRHIARVIVERSS